MIAVLSEPVASVAPNNHKTVAAPFTWSDVTEAQASVAPNNHKTVAAPFTWSDVTI